MRQLKGIAIALLLVVGLQSVYAATGIGREIDLGYYTKSVSAHPIDFSKYHPDDGFMLSMQKTSTELTPYASLDWGLGFAHYSYANTSMYSFSLFPAMRLWLYRNSIVRPFAELSIGPAYISKSHFAGSNLGSEFTFKNSLGIGLNVGEIHIFSFMLKYVHYSNYGIFKHNQGLDIPIMFVIGYQL